MARIGVSAEFIGARTGGTVTYSRDLLASLARPEYASHQIVPYLSTRRGLGMVPPAAHISPRIVGPYNAFVRLPLTLPLELLKHPVDLLHVQQWGPPWSPVPMVASIHDLGFEREPQIFSWAMRTRLSVMCRRTAHRAVRVIAPSRFSADDLINIYDLPRDKIRLVPPAFYADRFTAPIASSSLAELRTRYGLIRPYILYVGSVEARKNVDRLIHAYAVLRGRRDDVPDLVIAGKPLRERHKYQRIHELPRRLGLSGTVKFLGDIPEADLPGLYRGAQVFAFLGAWEGFGYPPLEAIASGVPAVVANRASLPEVVGEAGLVVDPFQPEDVAQALDRVLRDPDLRRRLRSAAHQQVSQFTPERTARGVLEVYEECLAIEGHLQSSTSSAILVPEGESSS